MSNFVAKGLLARIERVKTQFKLVKTFPKILLAAGTTLVVASSITGCSTTNSASNQPTAAQPTAVQPASSQPASSQPAVAPETIASPTASSSASSPSTQVLTLRVTGAKSSALVKTLAVTSAGSSGDTDEQSGMKQQTLPFEEQITVPKGTAFSKALIVAKYPSGATDQISCTISVDGKEVSSSSSSSHEPGKCLFLNK